MSDLADRVRQQAAAAWRARSQREQVLIGVLGALALLWLATVLVFRPLLAAKAEALVQARTYQSLNARLRVSGSLSTRSSQRVGAPAALLSSSGAEYGLAPQVTPDGGMFRVTMADAPYDAAMRWLADVERTTSLRLVALRIERSPATGFVSVQLTVRG